MGRRQDGLPSVELSEIATSSPWCQRWEGRRHAWRHVSDGGFNARHYEVGPVGEEAAKAFVVRHHYSGSYPAAVRRYGLFDVTGGRRELVGVAVFGVPAGPRVLTRALPDLRPVTESLELSRFVLRTKYPGNSESWFLARCFEALRSHGVHGVVSFADPVPRRSAAGLLVAVGHVGTIYQATNAVYTGRATPRSIKILPDGTVLNERAVQKIRRQEPGHEYAERVLHSFGAQPRRAGGDPGAWLRSALVDAGVRTVRHRGAHRYVFRLPTRRRDREAIRLGVQRVKAYPKCPDFDPLLFERNTRTFDA
ncbi:hypothetical protein [Streptomyces sp. NRRL B-24484]|uniref:Mom family adenine methylcarbamoylation protein n=1 Tax=Streptomyces sp. NRRL B-24484 TaxID=1463833 RepID=UPI001F42C96F|nr:hypothetical protein [Streptomyces sp. NRRL B-24484]